MSLKQVIIVRADLKLPKGKMAAQVGHACVEATLRADKDLVKKWHQHGMAKIVVKVDDLDSLYQHLQMAKDEGIATGLITDAGKTTVAPGTVTCCALGPDEEEKIDAITADLKLV